MILRTIFLLTSVFFICSCQSTTIDVEGFDEALFRSDQKGCHGERAQMKETLMQLDTAFKGLSQKQIVALLGKPDRHELAPRSQKYYVYYIDPAPECAGGSEEPFTLLIRFSALDRSTEISYQNY